MSQESISPGFGFHRPTAALRGSQLSQQPRFGYWGYFPNVGGTVYLTKTRGPRSPVFSAYEFHGKSDTNITPGQTVSREWALRSAADTQELSAIGAVGTQWQTSVTTGSVRVS